MHLLSLREANQVINQDGSAAKRAHLALRIQPTTPPPEQQSLPLDALCRVACHWTVLKPGTRRIGDESELNLPPFFASAIHQNTRKFPPGAAQEKKELYTLLGNVSSSHSMSLVRACCLALKP